MKDLKEGDFLTKTLGVTYAVLDDNKRKGKINKEDKYRGMAARHANLFKTPVFRWLMRRTWGKEVLFIIFGKKRDKPLQFPTQFPFVHKTDEERVENMPWILEDKFPWVKTTKIDGTSATYILERKKFGKYEFYVTSRNVRQRTPDQKNYHSSEIEENVYWEMADKYKIEDFLKKMLIVDKSLSYVCVQGEIAGPSVQGNPHKLAERQFFAFNFIESKNGRWSSEDGKSLCNAYGIPWVPIIDTNYILPDDLEEFKLSADGPCEVPGSSGLREGYVYRSKDGKRSFKNVSRKFLLKKGE